MGKERDVFIFARVRSATRCHTENPALRKLIAMKKFALGGEDKIRFRPSLKIVGQNSLYELFTGIYDEVYPQTLRRKTRK